MMIGVQGARPGRLRAGRTLLYISLSWLITAASHAQLSSYVASVSPADAVSETPLTVRVELRQGEPIERAYFVYRTFTKSEWTRQELELFGNTAITKIAANAVTPPYIEYYVVLALRNGKVESHPLSESTDPIARPPSRTLQIPVIKKEEDLQVVFLSPELNAAFTPSDVLISVSLLRADSTVVRRATQLFLDGADVTQYAVLSDDMLVYVPDNHGLKLTPGSHKVTVYVYNRDGNLHRQATTFFTVLGEGEEVDVPATVFQYRGSLNLELRNEKVDNSRTWYNRGGFRFSGRQGDWRFQANAFLTTDESANRQPQNRYYTALESPWVLLGYGDSYPYFPTLVLNGKRVRGLNSSLRLGKFNVDLALGKTNRDVEGALLKVIPVDDLEIEQRADPTAAYAPIDSTRWGKYSYGTYARDIFAIRPSFGSGERYQIGFTWLKSKDDVKSIRYGTRPQENFVVGTDLISKFDQNRVELTAQAAFSAYNSDISSGNFTDDHIDSVYKREAAAVKDVRDILKGIITVNDNLRPLSFKKFSTVAYDIGLALNYFDNSFKASYLYRGSDYNSFGQTFLRTDIAGINVSDRIKLPEQSLFVTIGFERLSDNTSKNKPATTHFTTYSIALNYDPRSASIPSATFGYTRYSNKNSLRFGVSDSLNVVISAVDDQTNRFYLLLSHQFTFWGAQSVSFTGATSHRNDYAPRNLDVTNLSFSFTLNTKYEFPLQTTFGYTNNYNSFPSGIGTRTKLNYSTLFALGSYTLPRELAVFSCSVSPTLGDFRRFTVDASAQWNATSAMNLLLQYSFFSNEGLPNDDYWSLRYTYEF